MSLSPTRPLLSLLQDIQSTALASLTLPDFDPKTFVDLPLLRPLSNTSQAFRNLLRLSDSALSKEKLEKFLGRFFDRAGSDLWTYDPPDYMPHPEDFLPQVEREEVRNWALEVHSLWLNLSREVASTVIEFPERHTLLPLPEPVVVPGSRFREVYYWDSYWVVRGLIVSRMYDTAEGIVKNLLSLVDRYGFVPNGARTYYENRSQPPLLSAMVKELYLATGNIHFLSRTLPILIREYLFWNSDPHRVIIIDRNGSQHSLNRYYANWTDPRPECFTIDKKLAEGLSPHDQKRLYHDIATAAETGWDFSSRWMHDRKNLATLQTSLIVPADLNAYLLQMEENIAFIANVIGNRLVADQFSNAATKRRSSIDALLWNDDMGQWLDYFLHPYGSESQCSGHVHIWHESKQNRDIYASNFVPLWCGTLKPGDPRIYKVIDAFRNSGLLYPAGIVTSLKETGQQWDFPNAWPPLQHMIIEGLSRSGTEKGHALAKTICRRWLRTNFQVYRKTGQMLEKYDARACGEIGGGGEYTVQAGFGWTNGVALALLQDFGWPSDVPITCQ